MSDPRGSAHRDQERFLKSVPAHLELLRKARGELEKDPKEASTALRRFSRFISDEAARLQMEALGEAAHGLSEASEGDLTDRVDLLEGELLHLLPASEVPYQILIVEDDPTSALLAKQALQSEGRVIHTAPTAEEARSALQAHSVDLILLDLVLPDADGRHLLMELSRELGSERTSVVVLTAKGTGTTRAECFAYGASAFLEKPLDAVELDRIATDVLQRGRSAWRGTEAVADLPDPEQVRQIFIRMQASREATGGPVVLALVEAAPGKRQSVEGADEPGDMEEFHGRVATALQEGVDPGDVVGRWGVSELVVLFSGREVEACVRVLERVQAGLGPGGRSFVAGVTEVGQGALLEDAVSWASRLVSEARLSEDTAILHTTLVKTRPPFALVVEDDPITASLLRHRLERSGFEVEHQENGLRGLEAIRRTLPDLLVLDIRLPGMDGFEILSRMQDEGMTQNVRTMVLTGLGRESDVARAFSLGADDYLVKPFSPVELTARALRLVRR